MAKKQDKVYEPEIIDETVLISLHDLCNICGVDAELIAEMVEHGLLEPRKGKSATDWQFTIVAIRRSRSALRLHNDLELNWTGAALALELLDEIERLRTQLSILQHH